MLVASTAASAIISRGRGLPCGDLFYPASRSEKLGVIASAKEVCPAERCGLIFVVPDVRIGAVIEQKTTDLESAAFNGHMQGGVIAVSHEPLGINVDAVRKEPPDGGQVPLVDRKVESNGVASVRANA